MPKNSKCELATLSNKIPVIFQHKNGPAAAVYWWVRSGSCDELSGEHGFAHFVEHMLFKDSSSKETGRASTGRMANAIEAIGGEVNAYTSFDQTVYHVTCAGHHLDDALDEFGQISRTQKFSREDFEREREVILEEIRRSDDSPERQLFQEIFSTTFRKPPYGRPVIGFAKSLKAATSAKLEAFYTRNYAPSNMGIIVVGPLSGDGRIPGLVKKLEKHFGSKIIRERKFNRPARPVERALRERAEFKIRPFDVKAPTAALTFRAPELAHEDTPALDMLSGVLAMGELSRLYQKLFYGSSLVTDISGGLYVPADPGMFYLQAETGDTGNIPAVFEAILSELARIKSEGPSPEELKRVLVNNESEKLYATQTADGVASRLGFMHFVIGDPGFDEWYLDQLRNVDAKRVQDIAARYFDAARLSGVMLFPKGAKTDTDALVVMSEKILGNSALETAKNSRSAKKANGKTDFLKPDFFTLPSGMRAAYRHSPDSNVASVHLSALGGLRLELADPVRSAAEDWGAGNMMSMTWNKGAGDKDSKAIASIIEGHAASMEGFSGRSTAGMQMTGLARDWDTLSKTLVEVMTRPSFPADEVEHTRRVVEEEIKTIEDHTAQLCSKLFLESLFDKHPYGKLTAGSLQSVAGIDGARLAAFHRKWIRPERMVVSFSGAVKRPDFERWCGELEKSLLDVCGTATNTSPAVDPETPLKGPRWAEKKLGREQLHIVVGGIGPVIGGNDRFPLRILQTILGGQGGRLFTELREKRSLAYAISPMMFEGVEPGYIGTYIGCSPDKREEAIKGISSVLAKLASTGPTPAEMKRAKEYHLGRRAIEMQSDSSVAAHFGLETVYGLQYMDEATILGRVRAVSASDIKEVCRRYLVEPHMVTCVVG